MSRKSYAIIGFLAPLFFTVAYLILSSRRSQYSALNKAISELGSVDAPDLWAWNIFGYILPGLFIAVFALGLGKSLISVASSKWPVYSLFLSGVFMSLSGIFPGDFNDRGSFTMIMHTLGSFGSYLFFLFSAFTFPKYLKQFRHWSDATKPGLVFTWLTILFGTWVFLFPDIPALGQRFVFAFYFLWILNMARKLYQYEG